jgi:hypothetical protein
VLRAYSAHLGYPTVEVSDLDALAAPLNLNNSPSAAVFGSGCYDNVALAGDSGRREIRQVNVMLHLSARI